jgi:hypothetical protein
MAEHCKIPIFSVCVSLKAHVIFLRFRRKITKKAEFNRERSSLYLLLTVKGIDFRRTL